jgi:transposase InsO family protein
VSSILLHKLYYNPKTGYGGINDLARKSGLSPTVVKEWLSHQNVYTLHKPIKHRFKTRRVLVSSIDDQWQADLVDMQKYKTQNKGMNYILTVIDIFSKFSWAIPIKNKTGNEVMKSFASIFKERVPRKLHTDKGLEFINKPTQSLLKKYRVHWFATENETKAQVVERFNRTLKGRMWKHFTQDNNKRWLDILPDLISNYNSTYHRSIKMTPVEASLIKNSAEVYKNLFPDDNDKNYKPKFNAGERVRISKKRKDFNKGYLPNFTTEVFIIVDVLKTKPPTYTLKDMDGESIIGTFYEEEMVKYDDGIYQIEEVIRKHKNKLLVKWKGYDKPSWINEEDLIQS